MISVDQKQFDLIKASQGLLTANLSAADELRHLGAALYEMSHCSEANAASTPFKPTRKEMIDALSREHQRIEVFLEKAQRVQKVLAREFGQQTLSKTQGLMKQTTSLGESMPSANREKQRGDK